MAEKRRRMSDGELQTILEDEITSAVGYLGGDLSEQRSDAMERYYGEPYGDEAEGRSSVVLTEVRDTVEGIMPSLVKVFLSNDRIVTFEPVGPEDEQAAEQETDVVNYVLLQQNKNAFGEIHDWMKDALLQKNGVIKYWWEDSEKVEQETYSGLTEDEYIEIVSDDDVEVLEHSTETKVEQTEMGEVAVVTHDLRINRESYDGRVCYAAVPPEEFLISRRAVSIEEAPFVGHRVKRTISELIEQGYDRDQVESLTSDDDREFNEEVVTRFQNDDEYPYRNDTKDKSMQEVWVTECYIKVDYDGDGIAEMRKVVVAGDGKYQILNKDGKPDNEPFDGYCAPFASLSPVRVPHKFFGLSIADLVLDIQRIKTVLMRQVLDNQYLTNNPRKRVVEGQVNLDDLLTSRPGGIVRVKTLDAIADEVVPAIAQTAMPVMEYLDGIKENRTGWTKYNQGLDSESLNKTATGVTKIMNAAAERIELIARIFAETGFRHLFLGVHELLRKHQIKPLSVKLRNGWVPVSPQGWRERTDMTVTVGTGAGNADQRKADAMMVLNTQERLAAFGLVDPIHVYNSFEKLIEATGWKSADLYMKNPGQVGSQPQEQQPNPEMMKLQMDAQNKQAEQALEMQKFQIQQQFELQKFQFEKWLETQKLELQAHEVGAEISLKAMGQSGVEGPADALGSR